MAELGPEIPNDARERFRTEPREKLLQTQEDCA
jgi:hypothetical protein